DRTKPGVSVSGLSNAVAITAGTRHSCALLADGSVRCWGGNAFGQLGDGTKSNSSVPTKVPGVGSITARDVAAGIAHTCIVRANSTVACWGDNGFGQLGDGTTTQQLKPIVVPNLSNVVSIAAGMFHTCALLATGL